MLHDGVYKKSVEIVKYIYILKKFYKFFLFLPNRAPQETRMKNFKIPNLQDRTKGFNFDLNIGLKTLNL